MNKSEIVENYIQDKIRNKEYLPNNKIETIKEITKKLNVSEITVRNSINFLKQKNILYSIRGSGIFVSNTNPNDRNILILYHHYIKYDLYKTSRILIDKIKDTLISKNYNPICYPDKFTDIIPYFKSNNFNGVISVNASNENLNKIVKNRRPVIETNTICSYSFASVQYDFIKFYTILHNILKKYNPNEILIFNYFHSIHHLHPAFVIQYGYNKYLEKYNLQIITENENNELCQRKFKSTLRRIKTQPKLIVFLDENIYEICKPLFPLYDNILKNATILTHFTRDIEIDSNYKTIKIGFDLDRVSEKTVDLLEKIINKEFVEEYIINIPPIIIKHSK